jgi:hypothetical protein
LGCLAPHLPLPDDGGGGGRAALWRVALTAVRRGVRHGWCIHDPPFTHKFNFHWNAGGQPRIVYNMGSASQGTDSGTHLGDFCRRKIMWSDFPKVQNN